MSRRLRWFLPLFALFAIPALARVGGGEHFSSGSHSSHSGGGGGGDGAAVFQLIIFCIQHPVLGSIIVGCFIAFKMWDRYRQGDVSTMRAVQQQEARDNTRVSAGEADRWVNTLHQSDSAFDLIKFFERVSTQFIAVQNAWFRRDL